MAISATLTARQTARSSFLEALFAALRRPAVHKGNVLDVRGLSDHMKRDLGFLDGKDPAGSIR